jgi:hypothetical protein
VRSLPGALPPELEEPHLDATRTRRTRHKYLIEVWGATRTRATSPSCPICRGAPPSGMTPEAAVHEIGDATLAWIAACRASGDAVPEPTTKARHAASRRR